MESELVALREGRLADLRVSLTGSLLADLLAVNWVLNMVEAKDFQLVVKKDTKKVEKMDDKSDSLLAAYSDDMSVYSSAALMA